MLGDAYSKRLRSLLGDMFFTGGGWRLNEPVRLSYILNGRSEMEYEEDRKKWDAWVESEFKRVRKRACQL